ESIRKMRDVLEEAMQRPGGEIVITGHTDSLGDLRANDALSLQRALAIREMFIERGFDPLRVEAAGRGEREPLYPTADGVSEPRNRRAEIIVR
ncbi:MAG: OmpA family protein, partial [Rhodocyclaceae bacterium]|nr:OmpA family protein [Rhodocyclaceae bacterium]